MDMAVRILRARPAQSVDGGVSADNDNEAEYDDDDTVSYTHSDYTPSVGSATARYCSQPAVESGSAVDEEELTVGRDSSSTPNGNGSGATPVDKDASPDEHLTPPPESPTPDSLDSDTPAHTFEDEIVVGTKVANGLHSSPLRVTSDQEDDVEMNRSNVSSLKRKRSASSAADDDRAESGTPAGGAVAAQSRRPKVLTHGMAGSKHVLLGYWRASDVPDEEDKHAVIGFIDVRERLRTRIEPNNRAGTKMLDKHYPVPPGAGGNWVTFPNIVFEKHLVNCDQHVIKEYVRIRCQTQGNESPEDRKVNDEKAVKDAIQKLQDAPQSDSTVPVAYGRDIPEHAVALRRPEHKKRRVLSRAEPVSVVKVPMDPLSGTRPTKILVGYWKGSSEDKVEDKHAVYGILGANDMFRVKVTRETRDGRPVIGNFPMGAGALWIHYEEVEFDPHLAQLSRPEMKEYVRVRQHQLDEGELPDERVANETKAVIDAQMRVMNSYKTEPEARLSAASFAPITFAPNGKEPDYVPNRELQQRPGRRGFPDGRETGRRHALPDSTSEFRAANRAPAGDAVERSNSIARREIAARADMVQHHNNHHQQRLQSGPAPLAVQPRPVAIANAASNHNSPAAAPAAGPAPGARKAPFADAAERLQGVWAAQEDRRIKSSNEDAKMYMGIKYERKQNGPFEGKLVSQGTIISIDGEDYVEYRVLTKPSFF